MDVFLSEIKLDWLIDWLIDYSRAEHFFAWLFKYSQYTASAFRMCDVHGARVKRKCSNDFCATLYSQLSVHRSTIWLFRLDIPQKSSDALAQLWTDIRDGGLI